MTREAALNKTSDDQDSNHLSEGCQQLLMATSKWISEFGTSTWVPKPAIESRIEMLRLVLGAVAVKQSEALEAIVDLTQDQKGYAAVSLLRAMCEEYVWVKFLADVDPKIASGIITDLGAFQNYETFLAQDQHKDTKNLKFPDRWIKRTKIRAELSRISLKQTFSSLGFLPKKNAVVPSFFSIAKHVGEESLYRFLYHATSRVVHFSVPEIMRRIWGRPGSFTVSSSNFDRYWSSFALYWGASLYSRTFLEILIGHAKQEELNNEEAWADKDIQSLTDGIVEAMRRVQGKGAMPIITPEEVYWPDNW
jgi:hypothetical protein